MQLVKLIFKIKNYILPIIIILYSELLYAGSVQDARNARLNNYNRTTEIRGVKTKHITKASNGNLYINNTYIYSGSKDNATGRVSIETGRDTREVIIKNIRINSKNNSSITNESSDAILSIDTNKNTKINIKNLKIESDNVRLNSSSNQNKVCAAALCIQAGGNNDILIDNTAITTSSTDATINKKRSSKKNCVGGLCIQTENSDVVVMDSTITSNGSSNFLIRD